MLGRIEGKRRRGLQRMSWLDSITNTMDMSLSKLWKIVEDREIRCAVVHWVPRVQQDLATEQQKYSTGWEAGSSAAGAHVGKLCFSYL